MKPVAIVAELPGRNNVNVISLEIDVVEEADSVS
jgi:hypothetical protein